MAVLHQNAPISGTPYLVEAADPTKVHLQPTSQCFSGQECGLRVDASGAGRGSLSVGVKAAGQDIKHSIRDLGGGMYQVLFYPRIPIPHKVDVRYNGIPVKGTQHYFLGENTVYGLYILSIIIQIAINITNTHGQRSMKIIISIYLEK